jgi:hypothetical protein
VSAPATGYERWVVNKLRALCAWYTKGIDSGSHLRVGINSAESVARVRQIVDEFFIDRADDRLEASNGTMALKAARP